jgi:hypothetical protein
MNAAESKKSRLLHPFFLCPTCFIMGALLTILVLGTIGTTDPLRPRRWTYALTLAGDLMTAKGDLQLIHDSEMDYLRSRIQERIADDTAKLKADYSRLTRQSSHSG